MAGLIPRQQPLQNRPAIDRRVLLAGLAGLLCGPLGAGRGAAAVTDAGEPPSDTPSARLVIAARKQVGVTVIYDPAYVRIAYPDGDIDPARGVCTDVVVRAYRLAFGLDLQSLVHDDMQRAFAAYPRTWGLALPDTNIDHRRVGNLETFFTRRGARLPLPGDSAGLRAGDLVTSLVGGVRPHIGIVSDRITASGRPLVIHNIGAGTREEDALAMHPLRGRFRWEIGA